MIKKITYLLVCLLFAFNSVKAQRWGRGIDEKDLNWGFTFQYISAEYKLTKARDWRAPYFDTETGTYVTDELSAISSPISPGFGIGWVMNKKINQNLDLRLTPSFAFSDRVINYAYVTPATYNPANEVIQKKVQATMLDIPLGLKIKSDRLMDFRAYMIGGIKYSLDLTSRKKTNDDLAPAIDKLIKNNRSFMSYEAGLGLDIYFEYFKMSPELKVSYSFNDILKHNNTAFATPIDQAKLRHFTFSLFFE